MYYKPYAIDGPKGRHARKTVDLRVSQHPLKYAYGPQGGPLPKYPKSWWRRFIEFIQGLFN